MATVLSFYVRFSEKIKMDAKIQILSEDRSRLQTFEKQHQTLLYENDRLKAVEHNNSTLQSRIEVLQEVEKKHKEAVEKIEALEALSSQLTTENKQIAALKEEISFLSNSRKELEILYEKQAVIIQDHERKTIVLQEKVALLNDEVAEKKVMAGQLKSLETEHQSMKKTIEDYHNANTNNEMSQQVLMKEIEELRKVEAQHQVLLRTHDKVQVEARQLELDLKSCKAELDEVKEISHAREKQVLDLKKDFVEKAESQKIEEKKLQQAHCAVHESNRKQEILTKDLANQKKEVEAVATQLQEATTNACRLEQELAEVRETRDKERLDAQSQQQKLTELREMEINYKIVLSENSALKSVSENLKNLSFAYEKSEQKCQSLRDENDRLDQVRIENTELKCHAKSFEIELKDGIVKREKLASEILELKAQMENARTQSAIEVSRKCNDFENKKSSMKADFESKLFELATQKESLQRSVDELTKLKGDWVQKEEQIVMELEALKDAQRSSAVVVDRKNEEDSKEKIKEMELFHINQIKERDAKIDLLVQDLDHLRYEYGMVNFAIFLFTLQSHFSTFFL